MPWRTRSACSVIVSVPDCSARICEGKTNSRALYPRCCRSELHDIINVENRSVRQRFAAYSQLEVLQIVCANELESPHTEYVNSRVVDDDCPSIIGPVCPIGLQLIQRVQNRSWPPLRHGIIYIDIDLSRRVRRRHQDFCRPIDKIAAVRHEVACALR